MLYIDYKFEMTDAGLIFIDTDNALEPDCLLKIDNTPFNVGDTFVLTQTTNGNMFFKKVDIVVDGKNIQLKLPFEE